MSFWTEYVIADVADAEAVAAHDSPRNRWPGFEGYKLFGPPHMAALHQALGHSAADWSDVIEVTFGEENCVHQLPPALVSALAKIEPEELSAVSSAWSVALSETSVRYEAETLKPLLDNLRELAVRANADGRPVLMWQCMVG